MDYQLKPVSRECTRSGQPLEPGSLCYSALVERQGQLVRMDFAADCWEGPPEGAVGYWRCRVPEEEEPRRRPLDADSLMGYFEQLCEDANPAQQKFVYIVALMLLQKRRLRIEGTRVEDEIEFLQLEGSHGEGPFEIRDQQLSSEEIGQLQNDMNVRLSELGEWA